MNQIGQILSDQFKNLSAVSNGRKIFLSWSCYLKFMNELDKYGIEYHVVKTYPNNTYEEKIREMKLIDLSIGGLLLWLNKR